MMHFLHPPHKTLLSIKKFRYFHRMRLFVLLSIISCSFSVAASCENEALSSVNINPQSVSKKVSACIPVAENRCEMTIEVQGETIGSMTVACDMNTDTYIETLTAYKEIGQY